MIDKEFLWGTNARQFTVNLLKVIALKYGLENFLKELEKENSTLFKKDIYICFENIVDAVIFKGTDTESKIAALKNAKNIYNMPIFLIEGDRFNIKRLPDFYRIIDNVRFFEKSLNMNIYNTMNTILTLLKVQITGTNLNEMFYMSVGHIERSIENAFLTNPNWDRKKETSKNPILIMPIGASGCGKSTFYKVLSNVVNISCDNIRYLLFKDYGPCFKSWESTICWWIVNNLTDFYIRRGYSVFYNGVNTDREYRAPMTMEVHDPIYEGLKYNLKLVYFEPPNGLTEEELQELKAVNLWKEDIMTLDIDKYSPKVANILRLIKSNYERTVARTELINKGEQEQDPYDVQYLVPPAVIKIFVEQSFVKPTGDNVIYIPRKNIPDAKERMEFYKFYAQKLFEK
ncbi:MAG TPA: hypothetical protein PLD27_11385 [bacterium]|nr:hypothetical protein [bacterium]HOL48062.1 hypothetical protein [bacterium]HPQ19915.1 hypothetical protein [bacterium]